jgi:hypothetical protein
METFWWFIFGLFLVLFFIPGMYQLLCDISLKGRKIKTQEDWEDEQKELGNITDEEWDKIQRKREILK